MNVLDANPEDATCVRFWSTTGQLVPIARDGQLLCLVHRRAVHHFAATSLLSAEDFITGLELLGHRFDVGRWADGTDMLIRVVPEWSEPQSWRDRAHEIIVAFGRGRSAEAIAFLRRRDARSNHTLTVDLIDFTAQAHVERGSGPQEVA